MNREELISTLLKSEEAPQEQNYLEYLRNKSNDELKRRTNNARTQTSRLGNILTNSERKAIKTELYESEDKNHTKRSRERAIAYLINLQRHLEDK